MNNKIKQHLPLFFILFSFLIVLFNNLYMRLWGWDESVYVGMSKYIVSLGKIGLWENIRPIGLPTLLSIPGKLLDYNIILIVALFSIFSLAYILMTYMLSYKITKNKWISTLNAALVAFHPLFIFNSTRLLTTIPATVFLMMAVYFFIEKKYFTAGTFCGIAFLFRFTHLIGGIGLGIVLVFSLIKKLIQKKKIHLQLRNILTFAGAVSLILLLFFLFNAIFYSNFYYTPTEFDNTNIVSRMINPLFTGGQHAFNLNYENNTSYYFDYYSGFLLSIFSIGAIFFFKNRKRLSILLPGILFLIFYTLITNKQHRFSLSFLYLIVIASTYFFYYFMKKYEKSKISKTIIIILLIIVSGITFYQYYDSFEMPIGEMRDYNPHTLEVFSTPDKYEGIFYTTYPHVTAYSNKLFIPLYEDPDIFLKKIECNQADYMFFYTDFFPFEKLKSPVSKQQLIKELEKYKIVEIISYYNQRFEVRKTP